MRERARWPGGRRLTAVTQAKDADGGKAGKMPRYVTESGYEEFEEVRTRVGHAPPLPQKVWLVDVANAGVRELKRSEEHTSELQSLMRIPYAVFCLKKKKNKTNT